MNIEKADILDIMPKSIEIYWY